MSPIQRSIVPTLLALILSACSRKPDTPLCTAADAGNAAAVRVALTGGLDPNEKDGRGFGAIHWAARGGHVETILALIEGGADASLRDHGPNGWTPLMHAVHKKQGAAVRTLLDAGADPDAACGGGLTALMMAAGCGDAATVTLLLAHGADPHVKTADGLTALWSAAGGGAIDDFTDGPPLGTCFPDVIRLLKAQAPDLKLERRMSTRALAWLAKSPECKELVKSLQEG